MQLTWIKCWASNLRKLTSHHHLHLCLHLNQSQLLLTQLILIFLLNPLSCLAISPGLNVPLSMSNWTLVVRCIRLRSQLDAGLAAEPGGMTSNRELNVCACFWGYAHTYRQPAACFNLHGFFISRDVIHPSVHEFSHPPFSDAFCVSIVFPQELKHAFSERAGVYLLDANEPLVSEPEWYRCWFVRYAWVDEVPSFSEICFLIVILFSNFARFFTNLEFFVPTDSVFWSK